MYEACLAPPMLYLRLLLIKTEEGNTNNNSKRLEPNNFSRKIGCNTLAFFVSGPERTPNGSRTDPEQTPHGSTPHGSRSPLELISNRP